jgi:hypothetical protein
MGSQQMSISESRTIRVGDVLYVVAQVEKPDGSPLTIHIPPAALGDSSVDIATVSWDTQGMMWLSLNERLDTSPIIPQFPPSENE